MSTAILKRAFPPRATAGTLSHGCHCSSSAAFDEEDAVSTAVSVLIHQRSKSRWSNLSSLFPHGFTPSQITQILLKIRHNPKLAHGFFDFVVRQCPSSPPPLHCYASIIHIVARARLKTRAQTLIKEAVRISESEGCDARRPKLFRELVETYRVCDSAPLVFNLLIESLLEVNRLDASIEIVRLLRSRGFRPHVKTCNLLVSAALRRKGCDFGYDLYGELFGFDDAGGGKNVNRRANQKLTPNVHTFNELMLAFHREGSVDMVEELWIEMAKLNCSPKVCSYSILMAVYCEKGEMDKARDVWEDLRANELRPDVAAYNTIIGGYCRVGEIEKAEELYREMGLGGLEGTCVTYQHLINGYCLCEDADSAMLVYKDLHRKGFSPDNSTLNTMVRVLCDRKSVSEAFAFFTMSVAIDDFVATERSYCLLIEGLCSEGKLDEALKLQAQMMGHGFKPDSHIYDAFIDGYIKQGKPDVAERLREEMMENQA